MSRQVHILFVLFTAILLITMFTGCGEQPDLPASVNVNPDDFGANDTTFVRLGPDWNSANGYDFVYPTDIQVGREGYLYFVDHNTDYGDGGRVVQMTRSGSVLNRDLFADQANAEHPIMGIGQDSRLNMFMVRGDSEVYIWNQYLDITGIDAILLSVDVHNPTTAETIHVDNTTTPAWELLTLYSQGYYPIEETAVWSYEAADVDPYREEYVLYQDTSRSSTVFTDVDAGVDEGQIVYLSDEYNDRVIGVWIVPDRIVLTPDGTALYTYTGVYDAGQMVASFGQGQASTNNPTGVASSRLSSSQSAIFYTQRSGNYLVQKVKGSGEEWFFDFTPTPAGEPEVLHLNYFGSPMAVAVAERDELGLGLFYVADSMQNRVPAFFDNGFLFREVAFDEELIDLTAGDVLEDVLNAGGFLVDNGWSSALNPDLTLDYTALADTTVRVKFSILNGPKGVATLEGVVYIADSGNDRILRFKRSDVDSYLPDEGN